MYREYVDERGILVITVAGMVGGLDRRTGETVWTADLPYANGTVEFSIHLGRVFAAANPGWVYCLDYQSGELLWHVPCSKRGTTIEQVPALLVDEDCVYVMSWSGEVSCFDLEGKEQWTRGGGEGRRRPTFGFPGNVSRSDG